MLQDKVRFFLTELIESTKSWRSDPAIASACDVRLLEARVMMSASPIAVDAAAQNTQITTAEAEAAALSQAQTTAEIAFVDATVANQQELIADLEAQRAAGRSIDIVLLDADKDGLEQISETLSRLSDVGAIHILSHAENDAVKLGNVWLSERNLDAYAGQLALWQSSLSSSAQILFYGCDLAANESGRTMLAAVSELTGAEVAASEDATGSSLFGADWQLEYATGTIDVQLAISHATQASWLGKLATISVTTFLDVVDSGDGQISLREAIQQANAGDTILLAAGTYRFDIEGDGENAAGSGDLDLLRDVRIVGAGNHQTTIDALGIDRVFHVISGRVQIENLSIRGGYTAFTSGSLEGGGIRIESGAQLSLQDVSVSDNTAGSGGGISNSGILTLTNVTIDHNTSSTSAGGISNVGTATLSNVTVSNNVALAGQGGGIFISDGSLLATNLTVSGNSASGIGGGISTQKALTLQNATITNNTAAAGSGIVAVSGSSVSVRNSIIAGNSNDLDVAGSFNSLGHNLIGRVGSASGFVNGVNGDQVGTASTINAGLDVLKNNFGPVQTHALFYGSAAIDTGSTTGAPTTDARGVGRHGNQDVGAFEYTPTLTPINEIRVNQTTSATQNTTAKHRGSTQAVSMSTSGNYVVVWSSDQATGSDGNGYGVLMRVFRPNGSPLTGEIQVNQFTSGHQVYASVATDSQGNGVVVWTSENQDSATSNGIYARRFQANGSFIGNEFRVNTTAAGVQENPVVAMNSSGQFVVAWEGEGVSGVGIYLQRFNESGVALGSEFRVNEVDPTGVEHSPAVAINDVGQFAVAWDVAGYVVMRRFESDGSAATPDIVVNTVDMGFRPSIAIDELGQTVVVFRSDGVLGIGAGIWGRAFHADGTDRITAIAFDTGFGTDQGSASISMDRNGNFNVVYHKSTDGNGLGVFLQRYTSAGVFLGTIEIVNSQTISGGQGNASLAVGADHNNFVVVWSGQGTGDTFGVFARQFTSTNRVTVSTTSDTLDGDTSSIVKLIANKGADGHISLREAIEATNNTPNDGSPNYIDFEISAPLLGGAHTILLASDLPLINDTVIIDATTDSHFNGTPIIVLNGNNTANSGFRLTNNADGSVIRGFIVSNFVSNGIWIDAGSDNNTIEANWIGQLDVAGGSTGIGNRGSGIYVQGANNTIGGNMSETRNVISGNTLVGVMIEGNAANNNAILGNYIGTNSSGTIAIGNNVDGIRLNDARDTFIGTKQTGTGNLISGNMLAGISIYGATSNTDIYNNFIGTQADRISALGNSFGIRVLESATNVSIGGTAENQSNTIAFNVFDAIKVRDMASNVTIRGNRVRGNTELGIDLGDDGVTPNDNQDTDMGPNQFQNTPILTTANISGATLSVQGSFNSTPFSTFLLDFYASGSPNEGDRYLTTIVANTDSNGDFDLVTSLSGGGIVAGEYLSVTATNSLGNTSEFNSLLVASNSAPQFASPGAVNVSENSTFVIQVSAVDPQGDPVNYSIVNGADSSHFTINPTTGALRFLAGRDYESPSDIDANNTYVVQVAASDGTYTSNQTIVVSVTPINEFAPVITSSPILSVNENSLVVNQIIATDSDLPGDSLMFFISGSDANEFSINSTTGVLTFISPPDFESPTDFDSNNIYSLMVTVFDGTFTSSQLVTVTVTNLNEFSPVITSGATYTVNENSTAVTTITATERTQAILLSTVQRVC